MLPRLLNPVKVKIMQIDKSSTQFNTRLRENVNIIKRNAEFEIDAQIVYKRSTVDPGKDNPNFEGHQGSGLGGIVEESDGYLVLRFKDLTDLNIELKRGDKITKLAQINVEYFITGTRPGSHYTDQGGFTLLQVFFKDRAL